MAAAAATAVVADVARPRQMVHEEQHGEETYGPAGTGPKVVRRGGHIIPMIRLTPPDSRPCPSDAVPEQELGKNSLYVPLRTEEVGWEEGGLIWAPKRYWYPTVSLYGGADDHVIGTYRGGPKGYSFVNITDSAFRLANGDGESGASNSNTGSGQSRKDRSRSQLPKAHVATMANKAAEEEPAAAEAKTVAQALEEQVEEAAAAAEEDRAQAQEEDEKERERSRRMISLPRRSSSVSSSASSSASTSRRGSSSTTFDDDEAGSGADTGMTTPAECESPMDVDTKMADRLEAALHAIKEEEVQIEPAANKAKLASRVGKDVEMEVPEEPIDAARLGGPFQASLLQKSSSIGLHRSLVLSPSVPSQHLQAPRGRSTSRPSPLSYVTQDRYNGGWAFEQNTMRQWL